MEHAGNMKSLESFLSEKKRHDYGRKGGQGGTRSTSSTPYGRRESRANMQDPSRSQRGGKPDPFKSIRGRKKPVNIPSQSGELITNFKADANVPPEEQFQRLVDKATKDAERAKDAAKSAAQGGRIGSTQPVDPSERAAARQSGRSRTGGNVSPDSLVGNTPRKPRLARRSVRGSYVVKQDQVSKLQKGYRELEKQRAFSRAGKWTQARMSRGYGKNLAATGDAIIQSIRDQSKAETAAGNKEFKRSRYGYRKSGPSTNLRTPAASRTYKTGVQKGYFDPKTGRVSEKGIQKHVNMRTVGGENFGKFKGKDPRAALKGVENIVSRAASGDKAARSEVRRSYKAIDAKYKPSTGARPGPKTQTFSGFQQQVRNIDAPKLAPTKKLPLPGSKQPTVTGPKLQRATSTGVKKTPGVLVKDKVAPAKLDLKPAPETPKAPTKPRTPLLKGTKNSGLLPPGKVRGVDITPEAPKKAPTLDLGGVKRSPAKMPSSGAPMKVSMPAPTKQPSKSKVTTNMGGKLADTSLADKVKQARAKLSGIPKPPAPSSLKKQPVPKATKYSDKGLDRLLKAIKDPNYGKTATLSRAEKASMKALKDAQKHGLMDDDLVSKRFLSTRGTPKGYEASRQADKAAYKKAAATQRVIKSRQSPVTQAKAQAGIQRGLQKSATSSFYKAGGFKTGAAGLAGLAGYGAYKQEKARGASDARASLRGAVKGAGAYLGAKGGYKLAAKLSKGGGAGRALAGAVVGFTALSQLADKGFKAFAGATAKEKAAMAQARGNAAPSKASRRWTSSNPFERFGRTVRQSKIPVLSDVADKYFKSRGG